VLAALAAGCATPGAPQQSIPDGVGDARFLSVANDARGSLIVGSKAGIWISRDVGRTWKYIHPVPRDTTAIAYGRSRVFVARGKAYERRDGSLTRVFGGTVAWPFGGSVTALASEPRGRRLWAVTHLPQLALAYSNDDGLHWYGRPATGLCPRPRAIAASPPARRDGMPVLYVACGVRGLQRSDDLGISFHTVEEAPWTVLDVSTALSVPGGVAIVTPIVRVSRDGGATWLDSGLSAKRVALDPRNRRLVFAIAENGRLFTSVDGGRKF
jgi:hypothetical protein